MLAPLLALLLAAQTPAFDAPAYRAQVGAERFATELARLQVAQEEAHYTSVAGAERVAAMLVAQGAASPEAYREDIATLTAWRDALRARIAAVVLGQAPPDDAGNIWTGSAIDARDPDLRALYWRTRADQLGLAEVPERLRASALALYWAEQRALNQRNVAWLRGVLARIGWFDNRRYGEQAALAAWLLVQHADHDRAWQAAMLRDLRRRAARGEILPRHVAYLTDRVEVNYGRPQVYGTQGRCNGPGNLQLSPVANRAGLDARRAAMGLETLEDYRIRYCGRGS